MDEYTCSAECIIELDDLMESKIDALKLTFSHQFDSPGTLYDKMQSLKESRELLSELHKLILLRRDLFKKFVDGANAQK